MININRVWLRGDRNKLSEYLDELVKVHLHQSLHVADVDQWFVMNTRCNAMVNVVILLKHIALGDDSYNHLVHTKVSKQLSEKEIVEYVNITCRNLMRVNPSVAKHTLMIVQSTLNLLTTMEFNDG